jgi:hypothetical protein
LQRKRLLTHLLPQLTQLPLKGSAQLPRIVCMSSASVVPLNY